MIERKIDVLEEKLGKEPAVDTRSEVQELDDMIGMVDHILTDRAEESEGEIRQEESVVLTDVD
jgi:hypothetical protein